MLLGGVKAIIIDAPRTDIFEARNVGMVFLLDSYEVLQL